MTPRGGAGNFQESGKSFRNSGRLSIDTREQGTAPSLALRAHDKDKQGTGNRDQGTGNRNSTLARASGSRQRQQHRSLARRGWLFFPWSLCRWSLCRSATGSRPGARRRYPVPRSAVFSQSHLPRFVDETCIAAFGGVMAYAASHAHSGFGVGSGPDGRRRGRADRPGAEPTVKRRCTAARSGAVPAGFSGDGRAGCSGQFPGRAARRGL